MNVRIFNRVICDEMNCATFEKGLLDVALVAACGVRFCLTSGGVFVRFGGRAAGLQEMDQPKTCNPNAWMRAIIQ
jgi:hypothetical protein